MRVGIDIDDVLTNTSEKMKEYLDKYEKSGDGIKYIVEVMRGEIPTQNIKNFIDNYIAEILRNVSIKENAKKTIDNLKKQGHEIIFITARGEKKFKGSEKATLEFFKEFDIKYTDIIFNSNEKQMDCKNRQIDIMIDDSVKNCELISKEGIKAILFTSEVNKDIVTELERVDNWTELEQVLNSL